MGHGYLFTPQTDTGFNERQELYWPNKQISAFNIQIQSNPGFPIPVPNSWTLPGRAILFLNSRTFQGFQDL